MHILGNQEVVHYMLLSYTYQKKKAKSSAGYLRIKIHLRGKKSWLNMTISKGTLRRTQIEDYTRELLLTHTLKMSSSKTKRKLVNQEQGFRCICIIGIMSNFKEKYQKVIG